MHKLLARCRTFCSNRKIMARLPAPHLSAPRDQKSCEIRHPGLCFNMALKFISRSKVAVEKCECGARKHTFAIYI